jgi:hypothetical protein
MGITSKCDFHSMILAESLEAGSIEAMRALQYGK